MAAVSETVLTKVEVLAMLANIPKKAQPAVVCALIGHSKIISFCFGYISCCRCEEQIGDMLASHYDAKTDVMLNHFCPDCRENEKKLTWRDTFKLSEEARKYLTKLRKGEK